MSLGVLHGEGLQVRFQQVDLERETKIDISHEIYVLKNFLPVLSFPRHIGTPSPSVRTWASASCSGIKFILLNNFIFIYKRN